MSTSADLPAAGTHPDAATALLKHPVHIRSFISQIPQTLLSTLLTLHFRAYQPKSIIITSLTPKMMSLAFLQPVEDIGFAPVARRAAIEFTPPLPPIPPESAPREKVYEWESECAARLKEMENAALTILEQRSNIAVTRYLPPKALESYLAMAQFVFLMIFIIVWINYGRDLPFVGPFFADKVFNKEWKFTATVAFHTAIIVKRWGDVLNMAKKCRKHRVDQAPEGRIRGPWLKWVVTAFFEGWRAGRRFDEEVARVGRAKAEREQSGEESKKKK